MENWGASLGAVGQGALPTFIPPAIAFPMVATRDIGRVAAQALIEGGSGRQVIELSGPREYSADDVAAEVAAVTGTPVTAQLAPLDAVVPAFTSFGISKEVAELYRELYAAALDGRLTWEGGGARAIRGTTPLGDVVRALLKR
jgi:uncharacterized protein YbjT (DUF2867 family)